MKRADRVLPENAYKASPQADNHTRAADFTPKGFHPHSGFHIFARQKYFIGIFRAPGPENPFQNHFRFFANSVNSVTVTTDSAIT